MTDTSAVLKCITSENFSNRFRQQSRIAIISIFDDTSYEWILFVDSDIGVVNEKIKIEDYIRTPSDIIFYDRFFNFEIMAGSYLAKRTEFTIKFLHDWANYEKRLPSNFNGSDNGAIHSQDLVSFFFDVSRGASCPELDTYTNMLEGKGWARDAWLTNSHWSPERDFMFHSLKERDREEFTQDAVKKLVPTRDFYSWINTLKTPLDIDLCRKGEEDKQLNF
ncbi:hypothetical protein DICVIV_04987 [Dictyocaulus viviparus]|uniref:Nucleotide-diphospho-sugar transferase domain-containing protein n=1 Tax=Dictyocaulus viviparus TaxID=29172 RepID=A0A0D8Y2R6_DICVI|nr:hypothetical protein DICVIV_04987 [Dictyocaulus viviparus]